MRRNILPLTTLFIFSALLTVSCNKKISDDSTPPPPPPPGQNDHLLGWNGQEDLGTVPTTVNFGIGEGNLPSSVDLTPKFPPVGDQGQFGTCVAWAVAYNLKTALDGMDRGLSSSQLANASNQFSPRDLFTAIPDAEKGGDCNGTNFSTALDVVQTRGVATMQTVPYMNYMDCSQSNLQSNWTSEANQHKIKYWRKIEPKVQTIKQYLASNVPVVMGAKLSDNFMTWNSDNVLSSNTTYNITGIHGYHALVVAGYDDNKGPSGAFKIINSWGTGWGSKGYIWVDYNFFVNEFCVDASGDQPLFIAANDNGNVNPPDPDPTPNETGVDLTPWIFSDYSTYETSGNPNERQLNFNLYNIGSQTASPNADWSIYYIYYNAYDANDYGVLFYDNFNTSTASNTFDCPSNYNCIFNYPIPAGGDLANTVFNDESLIRTYDMPRINGSYYLLLIADANNNFAEQDELNNLFYSTLLPKDFQDGYALRSTSAASKFEFKNNTPVSRKELKANNFNTAVKPEFKNAYTPQEILGFIKKQKKSGALDQKVNKYIQEKRKEVYKH
jgi:hypothetical protein